VPGPIDPRVYARLFEEDREGAAVLEELTLKFARPAVMKGGIDAVLQTYHNDGARSVLQHIVSRINQAHGVIDTDHDDPE
jgi:hypothetical protein